MNTQTNKDKINLPARRRARRFALQAVYQWQLAQDSISVVEKQYLQQEEMVSVDVPYFQELLHGVVNQQQNLDEQLQHFLDRSLKELDPIELAILRMGAFELLERPEIPYRVVLNEAIELAKEFGATDGHKYVNGILNKLARKVRAVEIK